MAYERIWLQEDTDPESEWEGEVIVTWCADQINDDDIEYVLATRISELEAELQDADKANSDYAKRIQNLLDGRYRRDGAMKKLERENERLRSALTAYDKWYGSKSLCGDPECYQCNIVINGKAALDAAKGR